MVSDASLFKTQHYKIQNKGKQRNSGKGVAHSLHLSVVAIGKETFL